MTTLLIVAIPIATTLVLGSFTWCLHLRLQGCLRMLERHLEGSADDRTTMLARTIGEGLRAQRDSQAASADTLARLGREIERLGADVVNLELYRGDTPRHGDAIDAVRHGGDVPSLMREHGLPLEEAELLVSLYGSARVRAPNDVGVHAGEIV